MKSLIKEITRRIEHHHDIYSIPVADLMWEEILYRSLEVVGETDAIWDSGSHKIGADILATKYGDISCKTGAKKYVKKYDTTYLNGNVVKRNITCMFLRPLTMLD